MLRTAALDLRFVALCALLVALLGAAPAAVRAQSASDGVRTLTVSKATGLDPAGEAVTVSGSGYDMEKGIYVAFCVMPPPSQLPTPCGGGADLSGATGSSAWISSNPPSYGQGLATPYGDGGTFSVQVVVSATIGSVDCRSVQCAVVSRSDHTRTSDRSQDVLIPVSFATPGATPTEAPATPSAPAEATPTPTATATATPPPTATPTPLPTRPPAAVSADGRTVTAGALRLSASAATGLDPEGAAVTVEGAGFDAAKGVYVALCALPASAEAAPGPCTSGSRELSAWVSSNPPDWGKDLATPYRDGGFAVELTLPARIDASTDCRQAACAIVTRADDASPRDRSQELRLPVTFAATSPTTTATATATIPTPASTTPAAGGAGANPPATSVTTADTGGGSASGAWLWAAAGIAVVALVAAAGFFFLRRGRAAGVATGCLVLLLGLLLGGCGSSSEAASPEGGATATASGAAAATATGVTLPQYEGEPPIVVIDQDPGKPQLPVTVRSADGREVTITDTSRIVSLWGNLTEVVFGLGLGANVVGRDITATFPEAEHIPLVTRAHDISAEGVLSLRPTVVLASKDNSVPATALEHIRNVGVPVVSFEDPANVDEVVPRIREIAAALGVPAAGEELAGLTAARMELVRGNVPGAAHPLRVAFLYMRGSARVYLIAGPHSGADSMIAAAGGVDAGTAMGLTRSFTPITSEALVRAAPDVILMTTTGLESVGGIDGLVKIPGIAQTPAGQNRRIVTMEDGLLYSFGRRTPFALDRLSRLLYGQGRP